MMESSENKPSSPVPPPKPPKRRTVDPPSTSPIVNETTSSQNQESIVVRTDETIEKEKKNEQLAIDVSRSSPPPPPPRSRPRPSPAPPSSSPAPLSAVDSENRSFSPTRALPRNDDDFTPSSSARSSTIFGFTGSTKSSSIATTPNGERVRSVIRTKAGNNEEAILSGMLSKRNREGKFDKCLFTLTSTSLLYQKLLPTTQELDETPVVDESSCKTVPMSTILVG
jgi:hypothetical protein